MDTAKLRQELTELRRHIEDGDKDAALCLLEQALEELNGGRLLTAAEAARVLGIRSVTTMKILAGQGYVQTVERDGRRLIPLAELERVRDSEVIEGIRASDRAHDAFPVGPDEAGGLTAEDFDVLEAGRPGQLPWQA